MRFLASLGMTNKKNGTNWRGMKKHTILQEPTSRAI